MMIQANKTSTFLPVYSPVTPLPTVTDVLGMTYAGLGNTYNNGQVMPNQVDNSKVFTGLKNTFNNGKITLNQIGNGATQIPLHDKLNTTLGLVSNFVNGYNAYQANKLANKQFNFSKDAWNRQWEAQKGLTNSRLADRQQRRFNESGGTGMTVSEYMNKYGVR
ncbi:hypothetical protein [Moraxella lincolnii]|uniref:hypothetical protein n=1 Tax=Lwoffella lincolnii TaxID=90241 RepID=UPI003983FC4F